MNPVLTLAAVLAAVHAQLYISTMFLYDLANSIKTFSVASQSNLNVPATTGAVYCEKGDDGIEPSETMVLAPCSLLNGMEVFEDGESLAYSRTIKGKLTTKVECAYQAYSTAVCTVTNEGSEAQGQIGTHIYRLGPLNMAALAARVTLSFPSTGIYSPIYQAQTAALDSIEAQQEAEPTSSTIPLGPRPRLGPISTQSSSNSSSISTSATAVSTSASSTTRDSHSHSITSGSAPGGLSCLVGAISLSCGLMGMLLF